MRLPQIGSGCDKIDGEQFKKTGVDYFDKYLMHAMTNDHYERIGSFEESCDKDEK